MSDVIAGASLPPLGVRVPLPDFDSFDLAVQNCFQVV